MNRHIGKRQRYHGFTLLEVLVAVVILAVGLLGLAALQSSGLRYNHSAYLRTQATNLAYDILDRMRANRSLALTSNAYAASIGTPASNASNCAQSTATCTPSQMAAFDLSEWKSELASALPEGDGSVSYASAGTQSRIYTIVVQWRDSRDPQDPLKQQTIKAQL